jgi:hypothetical protein
VEAVVVVVMEAAVEEQAVIHILSQAYFLLEL